MAKKDAVTSLVISPPNLKKAQFHIRGTTPYVQNRFGQTALALMREQQERGQTAIKKKRGPKDFEALYQESMHVSTEGWHGIPASGFKKSMVSACRLAGFPMTRTKLAVKVLPDGQSAADGVNLIRITKGEPHKVEHYVKNETGVADIRARGMWDIGWEAKVTVSYDGDQFGLVDVSNLLMRVGKQVGIGSGRPDSEKSCGMGWGEFELVGGE